MIVSDTRLSDTAHAVIQFVIRLQLVLLFAVIAVIAVGCSKEKGEISEVREAYEAKEYGEAVALCRHAIKRGIDTPEIYYFYGSSLVALNRDFEGFRQLREAARRDPEMSRDIASLLLEYGEQSFEKHQRSKSAKRMQTAIEIDPIIDIGAYLFLGWKLYNGTDKKLCTSWNFGPEKTANKSVKELVDEIIEIWGSGELVVQQDPNSPREATWLHLNCDKAYHRLGWQPTWDFADAVKQTVYWHRAFAQGANMWDVSESQIDLYGKQWKELNV